VGQVPDLPELFFLVTRQVGNLPHEHNLRKRNKFSFRLNNFPFRPTRNFAHLGYFLGKEIDRSSTGEVDSTRSDAMVNREGLCVVDAWLSVIGSRAVAG
jgi:hypothetical protein